MAPIDLTETGSGQVCELADEDAARLIAVDFLNVQRMSSGRWRIKPKQGRPVVGSVRVGTTELHIHPKLPIKRVLFLLGYAVGRGKWQDDTVGLREEKTLVPAVAQPLWRQTQIALAPGVLQGYRQDDAVSTVLRGRIRETDQLYQGHGLRTPLHIRYDELTVDIPENQILRTALERMLTMPGVDKESRGMLGMLLARLAGVQGIPRGGAAPQWTPNRLNARYQSALQLAEVVLRESSVEHGRGVIAANGFVLEMEDVFEDFVRVAVGEELKRRLGGEYWKETDFRLDKGGVLKMEPDLVWGPSKHQRAAVVDAKYFSERKKLGGDRDGVYQMIAYCTALGLNRGHLVYAMGRSVPTRHVIRNAGLEIVCHALDLDQDPKPLLQQISQLTDVITETLTPPVRRR